MVYFDYLALICLLILTPFNRQAFLFSLAFVLSLVFYHTLGFSSEDGGLIYASATAISYLCFTILSAVLKFDAVLILSFVAYWLTYFSASIDYSLSTGPNFFDIIFPYAVIAINCVVIVKLYKGRGPMVDILQFKNRYRNGS